MDNSVSMRWLLASNKESDQSYAQAVLIALDNTIALVPDIWRLEVSSVLLASERQNIITQTESDAFTSKLKTLNIFTDGLTDKQAFNSTIHIAREFNLSSYDASYLEIAIRDGLAIATLDGDLRKAAEKANVEIYLN
ncbi:MAG: type II toxin-antitoxin system VapC family toxin [Gammaproteobacteria bacterium]